MKEVSDAQTSDLGALLSPAALKTLRFILAQGGEKGKRQLGVAVAEAIPQVGDAVVERQLLMRSRTIGLPSNDENEEEDASGAVDAVADYRKALSDVQR